MGEITTEAQIAADLKRNELNASEITQKYRIGFKQLQSIAEHNGIDMRARGREMHRRANAARSIRFKDEAQLVRDLKETDDQLHVIAARYNITRYKAGDIARRNGIKPVERDKAIRRKRAELDQTIVSNNKSGTWIPESLSGDGMSLHWLGKPWKQGA